MAITGMPNIPNFAGLASAAENAAISLGASTLIKAVFGTRWGIVNQHGVPILLSDSVISVNYENTQDTSKDPIEGGKVLTYNKINNPKRANVVLAKGSGGSLKRGLWLAQLETYANSTLNFHIVTPDYVFTNMQIIGLNYSRTATSGLQRILASLDFEECKIAKVKYNTEEVKQPQDAKTVDSGKVQPTQKTSLFSDLSTGLVNSISKLAGN